MGTRAITYSRVSTTDQATSGLGLEAQRSTMATYCQHKGWATTAATDEGASGKTMNRPGLMAALEALDRGDADVLVVATLDRLSRSIVDFVAIQERAAKRGWSFVLLDLDVDTTTPTGEMMATVMAAVAQLERKLIGQRTSKAMQAKKARGTGWASLSRWPARSVPASPPNGLTAGHSRPSLTGSWQTTFPPLEVAQRGGPPLSLPSSDRWPSMPSASQSG